MSDFYRNIKPSLNKLSELNVWDSLFVIRQYLLDAVKNYNLDLPHFEKIENHKVCSIPLYLVDFMIQVTLRYSTTHQSEKSLRQLKQRHKIISPIYDAYEKANEEQYKDILVWLKSYMLNQFKVQHYEPFDYRVIKYYYIYSCPSLASYVEEKLGIDVKKYFQFVILFYFCFSKKYSIKYQELMKFLVGNGQTFTKNDFSVVLDVLSASLSSIKANIKVDYSSKLFLCHNDAIHVSHPIISDSGKLYCVAPHYILNAGVEGLQYQLDLKSKDNQKLNDDMATRFEEYVGLQLDYFAKGGKYKHVKELTYNKGQNKTSDWVIYDEKCMMFVDCKLKKLTVASIMETELDRDELKRILNNGDFKSKGSIEKLKREQKSPLIKDMIGLGVDLGKILCCYLDWKDGKIKGLPQYCENMQFTASLLMLDECLCNQLEIKDYIDAIAYKYVREKRGVEPEGLNTRVISSITLDKSLPYIAEHGLSKYVIEDKYEIPAKLNIKNPCLHEQFDKMIKNSPLQVK